MWEVHLRKVRVEEFMGTTTTHYYLRDDTDSPYYKVRQDTDTESIRFVNPASPSKNETILMPLTGYPDGCKTIADVIYRDMVKRGFMPVNIGIIQEK